MWIVDTIRTSFLCTVVKERELVQNASAAEGWGQESVVCNGERVCLGVISRLPAIYFYVF